LVNSDESKFLEVMATLDALYEKKPNMVLARMMFKIMGPYTYEQFSAAVESHISSPNHGSFYPKPADLIRAIRGENNKAASKAFQGVIRLLERVGDSQPFKSDDKALSGAVSAIGGWDRLCKMTYSEINALESDFYESYNETKTDALQLINSGVQQIEQ